jgi:RNA polymerase sigma-70 factor (ECF subfamily)
MRILNNRDEAEDVLQESFLTAFQTIQIFETQAAFGSWLKRVVINKSIDLIRKQKQQVISLDDMIEVIPNEQESEVENQMDYDIETVKEGIQKLPDGYRIVLTLYLFEDYSHKDIAAVLNISEGTSKSQYNRAKKKLIEFIQQNKISHAY